MMRARHGLRPRPLEKHPPPSPRRKPGSRRIEKCLKWCVLARCLSRHQGDHAVPDSHPGDRDSRPDAHVPPVGPPEFGPAHGTLMIIGGGLRSEALLKQFIALAGGPDASILFIPTAGEGDEPGLYWEDMRDLQAAGARRVTMLHTRDRKVADSDAFVAPIRQATGVFIGGGRHWRLSDAYLNTKDAHGTARTSRPRRRHRGNVGGRHHPVRVHGAGRHQGQRDHDRRPHAGSRVHQGRHHRSARAPPQSPVRLDSRDRAAPGAARHRHRRGHRDRRAPRSLRGRRQQLRPSSTTTRRRRGPTGSSTSWLPAIASISRPARPSARNPRGVPIDRVQKKPWKD
jgi:hypothetical protein